MSHQIKIKPRPPPLLLEPCSNSAIVDVVESPLNYVPELNFKEEQDDGEIHQQFEGTLISLLQEEELMPFNIHTAASLGITESVRHLVERCNVDPNSRNSGNWTALMYASLFSHNETVLYLLEMKADVNAKNPNGKTPLMLASVCGSNETIQLLLQHGASLEEQDQDQFTALMLAIAATHCESANILLEHGANPNVKEEIHGQTPLYIAAQSGQLGIARALIQRGVDVDAKTSSGDSAYHAALRNGYPSIANLIKEKQQSQQSSEPLGYTSFPATKSSKPSNLAVAPTQYRPKSPYSAFFDRLPDSNIPEVVIHDVDDGIISEAHWFPSPGDITNRYSPEGLEEPCGLHSDAPPTFNVFNAWPGASMILKQAVPFAIQPPPFKKSITKPVRKSSAAATPKTPTCQWSPVIRTSEEESVKLPKDLSTVLADLGLTKYQMHFEEQDIDLQVFLTMNEADLREIGINSLGARRKCLSTIAYYQMHSNHYQIGEEFMVNAWVSKRDLADLKQIWSELSRTVAELRAGRSASTAVGSAPVFDRSPSPAVIPPHFVERLVKLMQRADVFFQKY